MDAVHIAFLAELITKRRNELGSGWKAASDSEICRYQCLEFSKKFAEKFGLKVVPGFYEINDYPHEHWWCVDDNGQVIDPTATQFSKGGTYSPHSEGKHKARIGACPECGTDLFEGDGDFCGEECFDSYVRYCNSVIACR